jgi:asparagine synthase (glutamine-hydrolysing)
MGVHFGMWNFDGKPIDPLRLAHAHILLRRRARFSTQIMHRDSLALVSGTSGPRDRSARVSRAPAQNHRQVLWSGRLDNRKELATVVGEPLDSLTDEEIVESAYGRSGTDLFSRIVGDWALSVVSQAEGELILARDFIGARPLFYCVEGAAVVWSTNLEPLTLLENHVPALSEEYLAGWLTAFPATHLTPYQGIRSVPPASLVRITPRGITIQKYWTVEAAKPIRYRTDREYEEHFRYLFGEAVRRRIRCDAPILAELSGGMDSSSIVCVADRAAVEIPDSPRLDTVTYFDSAEPNWDELPFARLVEEKRRRAGHHIDIGWGQTTPTSSARREFHPLPTTPYSRSYAAESFDRIVSEFGYGAVLSGIGGDEMLGGVPTPLPELADLVARLRLWRFLEQSFRWALAKRKPILGLWRSTLASFLPSRDQGAALATHRDWAWLTSEFRARNRKYFGFPAARFHLLGALPSRQASAAALEILRRQISCVSIPPGASYEWRYPFLDRDLVTFCCSIPREQLVRPHQRRSLLRRALAGMVPREILERKRKAYVSRGLVKMLAAEWQILRDSPWTSAMAGVVDSVFFSQCVEHAEHGEEIPILPLLRALALGHWLGHLNVLRRERGTFCVSRTAAGAFCPTEELLGREKPNQKGGERDDLLETRDQTHC